MSTSQQGENGRIALKNRTQDDGFYYVMIAEHRGDTRGGDWYTEAICLAADATTIPEAFKNRTTVPPENVIKRFG
ncbi:hypothetical protein D3C72_1806300 [compost metagenome]